MKNNPFEEIIPYVSGDRLSDKLMDAAIMWDQLTDEGNNPSDETLMIVLITNDLESILTEYNVWRNNYDSYDVEGLKEALRNWSYLH